MSNESALAVLILIAAALYSSVGHAGASGYLAAMAFLGIEPQVMKPTALALNILVASIATARYARRGSLSWTLLGPLSIGSVPMSFLGGMIDLPDKIFKPVVGVVLLFAAARSIANPPRQRLATPGWGVILAVGSGIGFLSGLTGTGGSIFLSPMLLSLGWASLRETAGIAAAFVLINSLAGLAGNLASVHYLPPQLASWALAAAAGAWIGTEVGSRNESPRMMQSVLAAILGAAGVKLLAESMVVF